jgi:purine-binding chemotaxis protein CheW
VSDVQTVGATASAKELYVVFKVGGADYALPARSVLQMESYTGATLVPGARSFVVGIVQLRGKVIPVVDLRARFGLEPIERTMDSRVVVVEEAHRVVALVADVAREVVPVAATDLKPPPKLVDDGAQGFVRAVASVGGRMVLVLDFLKVIGEESRDGQ